MHKLILFILCFSSLFLNCNLFDIGTKNNYISDCGCSLELPVAAFSKTYVNWAWGYTHNGWHVSNLGGVDSFAYAKSDSMWLLSDDSLITPSEMQRINSSNRRSFQSVKSPLLIP